MLIAHNKTFLSINFIMESSDVRHVGIKQHVDTQLLLVVVKVLQQYPTVREHFLQQY